MKAVGQRTTFTGVRVVGVVMRSVFAGPSRCSPGGGPEDPAIEAPHATEPDYDRDGSGQGEDGDAEGAADFVGGAVQADPLHGDFTGGSLPRACPGSPRDRTFHPHPAITKIL